MELARLRLSASILNQAIEEYRQKHQTPVLDRASELFSRITCGQFSALRADIDDRGDPFLVGIRTAGDQLVPTAGMSDGTCDQLYLAMRLASYESWIAQHEPMPLIVDDILVNFDNQRSVATLQALADISKQAQVIFFTHHQHLVDIAREHLPTDDLFVVELQRA